MDGAHAYTKVAPTLKGQDGQGWGDELTEGGWEVEARTRKLTPQRGRDLARLVLERFVTARFLVRFWPR